MNEVKKSRKSMLSGWVSLAGVLMILAGFLQAISGLVAVFQQGVYVATEQHLVWLDYTQWGWVHFILGLILIFSAISLFMGQLWGRIVAVVLACFSIVLNFGFLAAYPLWSIMIIVLDACIIYSVVVRGGEQPA